MNTSTAISSPTQRLARLLIAAIFLVAGVRKLLSWSATVGYFQYLGLPLPGVVLPLVVALELVGGVCLVAGWQLRWVSAVLGLFSLATACVAHAFWQADAAQFTPQLNNFLKNVAMAGGFLLLFAQASATAKAAP